jgi:threonine dehydratase
MMESLTALEKFGVRHQPGAAAAAIPAIDEHGRIKLPGFPSGLSVEEYLPLVHLYANVLEAGRILDRYRGQLRRIDAQSPDALSAQAPLTALTPSRLQPHLLYKREDQTVTQAYKVRGAVVGMAKMMESRNVRRFITVSTGNHALGVLKAAELLRPESVRVVVPHNTAPGKLEKLSGVLEFLNRKNIQADLLKVGQTFDEARVWAMSQESADEAYLDPYGDPWVVAGQGTLGLELAQQVRNLLQQPNRYAEVVVIAPVGGGGLLTGTAVALRMASAWEPAFRNLDVRFLGLRLEDPNAALGDAIRVAELADFNRAALESLRVPLLPMSDADMASGAAFVKKDIGRTVEGASGGAVHPALSHPAYRPDETRLVISVLSGANAIR